MTGFRLNTMFIEHVLFRAIRYILINRAMTYLPVNIFTGAFLTPLKGDRIRPNNISLEVRSTCSRCYFLAYDNINTSYILKPRSNRRYVKISEAPITRTRHVVFIKIKI